MSLQMVSSLWNAAAPDLSFDLDQLLFALFFLSFVIIVYVFFKRLRLNRQGPDQSAYYLVVNSDRAPYNSDCPVCLEELNIGAEGNCGHVYCSRCIKELERRRHWSSQLQCPLCRQRIQILFKFSKTDAPIQDRELLTIITNYNTFSLTRFPQNIWDTIRNMPVLLRHLLQRIMENGFHFDHILSSVLIFSAISIIYFLLPTDIFPELVFGVYGLIDDFLVLFYCLFQISIFYRNFLANGET